jgi:hypothetical protein
MQEKSWFQQEDLTVSLHTEDEGSFQGVVVETSEVNDGSIRVVMDFPRKHAPNIPVGQQAALVFSGVSLNSPLQVSGTVYLRSDDHFRHRYLFDFDRTAVAPLSQAVNSRGAARVQPDPTKPIDVMLKGSGKKDPVLAELKDISATGLSTLVPREDEQTLYSAWEVQVEFQLPGQYEAFEMAGLVRSRRLCGTSILYGIEFDPERTRDFDKFQEWILDYVMTRQAEGFRRARVLAKGIEHANEKRSDESSVISSLD